MKLTAMLAAVLALSYAGYWYFFAEAVKPAPAAVAAAAESAEPPKTSYQCSYTPSGQSETQPRDVYGVNVPTAADPSLETELPGVAKIWLKFNDGGYLFAQISTAGAGAGAPTRLLAEGQFSMKDGADLAALQDGVKVGTLTCGSLPLEAGTEPVAAASEVTGAEPVAPTTAPATN